MPVVEKIMKKLVEKSKMRVDEEFSRKLSEKFSEDRLFWKRVNK